MSYRIITDSCCDRTQRMKDWDNITFVPLTLSIEDYTILDDESFDQDDYIRRTLEASTVAKTACPAPDAFASAMECDEENIFVITITDKLSGTYNSALQGKAIYEEEHDDKKIHVFNSLATSGLQSLVVEKIKELGDNGVSFDDIVEQVEKFIVENTELYFCLESFDVLNQNGRVYAMAASILKKLKLKLICQRTTEGSVKLAGQELAANRAIAKMATIIQKNMEDVDASDKRMIISHVCCEEKAKAFAEKIKGIGFGSVEIVKCSGLNSTYAANGGLIVSFTK